VKELKERLDTWVAQRLSETGRSVDPLGEQGKCGTRIGTPRPDDIVGAGATPLHKRQQAAAATIPAPEDLKTPNEVPDETKGVKLHGYVKK
jgi:hypothetical protein